MSAITAHIRVLRSDGAALIKVSREAHASGDDAKNEGDFDRANADLNAALVLAYLAKAKFAAADQLDEEEAKREANLHG